MRVNFVHESKVSVSNTRARPLICAHNTNSITPKLSEVRLFLSETSPFVFLASETMRTGVNGVFLPGYNCIERFADGSLPESRGLMVAVKRCARIMEVFSSPFVLAVEVCCGEDIFYVASVYACHRGHANRAASLHSIAEAMMRLQIRAGDTGRAIVMAGDFNMSVEEHERFLAKHGAGAWRLLDCVGDSVSYVHGATRSSLDRFMVSGPEGCFNTYRVCNTYDHSDHFPVFTNLNVDVSRCSSRRMPSKINRVKIVEKKAAVANSNYWAPLEALMDEAPLDELVGGFFQAAEKVTEETGITQGAGRRNRRRHPLRRATVRAIHHRRELACAVPRDEVAYVQAKVEAKRLVKQDQHADFAKFVARGAALRANKPRLFWRWLRSVSGLHARSAPTPFPSPVVNPATNVLAVTEETILAAWESHYAALFKKVDHKDEEEWEHTLGLRQREDLDTNAAISWKEVCDTLRTIDGFKAAGPSGVQTAFLQAALDAADDQGVFPVVPTTPLGRIVFKIVVALFTGAAVPDALASSLIISLHKKGPTSLTSNYRGISLMETLLKLVTTIVARRLQAAMDATDPLCREQAGFRTKEECAAQFTALHDVCLRRRLDHRRTLLAFIDFKTAFDSVPHAALLCKLKARGVCGHTLSFIRALYSNPSFQVVLAGGARGEKVAVERGVRQGCPLSPLLFNIYIDDILQGCKGVTVPGLDNKLRGLLFADDVVLLAHDIKSMKGTLRVVERWATKHGMVFGTNKCGVMKIDGDVELLKLVGFSLQGQEVPVVQTYTYLGFPFNSSLNLVEAAKARAAKAQTKLNMATSFLKNKTIPLGPKIDILRSCLLPALTYGSELFGMVKSVVAPLQSVWGKAVRMLVSGFSTSASLVLCAEFQLYSVYDVACSLRARAFRKFPVQLKTIMSDLCENASAKTWYGRTKTWIRRWAGEEALEDPSFASGLKLGLFGRDANWEGNSASTGAQRYVKYSFQTSAGYVEYAIKHSGSLMKYNLGMYSLVALRAGSFWTANRFAAAGMINRRYRNVCPCCEKRVKESEFHLLAKCTRWQEQRVASGLYAMICEVREYCHANGIRLTRDECVALLLGGAVGDELLDERSPWEKEWYMAQGDRRPLFISLLRYLSSIRSERIAAIWQHTTRNQSPNG